MRIPRKKVAQAARRYKSFSGHDAESVGKVPFPENPQAALAFGKLLALEYETVRDGRVERYRHAFASQSRPILAARFDGKQLYILGGEYTFTARGIVDKK